MDWFKVFRYFAYSIEIILAFTLTETVGLIPEIAGVRPILLIPVALTISFFESEIASIGFGAACGLLIDYGISPTLGFHAFLLAIFCYISAFFMSNVIRTNFFSAISLSFLSMFFIFFLKWLASFVLMGYEYFTYALLNHFFPLFIYTFLMTPILYLFNQTFTFLIRSRI